MKFQASRIAVAVSVSLLAPLAGVQTAAAAAVQVRQSATPLDLGAAPAAAMQDVVVALKLPNRQALADYVAQTVDPTSANYRKFLTTAQFKERFGPSDATVKRVTQFLKAKGIEVTEVHGNNFIISARASNATLSAVFGTAIHSFQLGADTYQHPLAQAVIPAEVADVVQNVAGLSTKPIYRSHLRQIDPTVAPPVVRSKTGKKANATEPTTGVPTQYDTNDFAGFYDVKPLYARGIDGTGTTIGIMTFASFTATDVGAYWATVNGGNSSTARITTVNASGKQKISANGADETTLDIEQSGGIAQGANVIVYEAVNTSAGEIQLYTKAITDNLADTLSISWGAPEVAEDPTNMATLENLFMESATHGVPISASAGDAGAYDLNDSRGAYPYPYYSDVLTIDYPGASPYVLSAGGTTLPGDQTLLHGTVNVPAVRPWGWDYLYDYIVTYDGQAYYYANLFPVGAGGGVSVQFPLPDFQAGLAGTQISVPGQSMVCFTSPSKSSGAATCTPGTDVVDLPANYAGRNVPDVSLDADPDTGYLLYYGKTWYTGNGGTSFVAPQLNGVFALLTQSKGGRLGYMNPQLYAAFKAKGYGTGSPFTPVASGDNLFWPAANTYNPGSGLGQLDVNLLSQSLAQ